MSVVAEQLETGLDLYDLLQVSSRAHPDLIHSAYRKLVRRHDLDRSENPYTARIRRQVNAAYAILRDAERRARYDAYRRREVTLQDRTGPRPYLAAPAMERNEPEPLAPSVARKAAVVCVAVMLGMLAIGIFTIDILGEPASALADVGRVAPGTHKRSLGDVVIDAPRLTQGPCGPQYPGPMSPC